ncbi:purE protein [Lapidilactobacillus dextrinicus DSM 20335]|uniref:N5-carboxyaminoimidazole ribonucleotide mutase n=1 Tax=Lapidilactobacillus dextrinicus DSM 20335 TaxID=1423738 RepID=A0A0R2BSK3_9LACO|nr:5-(carboxyamino)imidazole ribonucleotide mutase [Lapidilactobacillus dextrinicus]KRM78435.1 purE protein [Lapidilactobacillus dextrinicus DSM 20335]QFG47235.1 5-(carboxyamino)imidazole ribonucleotide mutase [Lapidilactobacillus dextrinicus]
MENVQIVMGSISDWQTLQKTAEVLTDLKIKYETKIISAHRTPARLTEFAELALANGVQLIIAGAGGAAHLPGMLAANTVVPVIGVPVQSQTLNGVDSLLSIVQMPAGVPVATMAIGEAGARNAGYLAAQLLGMADPEIQKQLISARQKMAADVLASEEALHHES